MQQVPGSKFVFCFFFSLHYNADGYIGTWHSDSCIMFNAAGSRFKVCFLFFLFSLHYNADGYIGTWHSDSCRIDG